MVVALVAGSQRVLRYTIRRRNWSVTRKEVVKRNCKKGGDINLRRYLCVI